jgi:hypothetical protein
MSIRGKPKLDKGRKKEIHIKVGDACLDDLATEKSSGGCMLIRITENEFDKVSQEAAIYVLMIVEDKSGTGKWKRIGMGQIKYCRVKEAVEYWGGVYDFDDWEYREFDLV